MLSARSITTELCSILIAPPIIADPESSLHAQLRCELEEIFQISQKNHIISKQRHEAMEVEALHPSTAPGNKASEQRWVWHLQETSRAYCWKWTRAPSTAAQGRDSLTMGPDTQSKSDRSLWECDQSQVQETCLLDKLWHSNILQSCRSLIDGPENKTIGYKLGLEVIKYL